MRLSFDRSEIEKFTFNPRLVYHFELYIWGWLSENEYMFYQNDKFVSYDIESVYTNVTKDGRIYKSTQIVSISLMASWDMKENITLNSIFKN